MNGEGKCSAYIYIYIHFYVESKKHNKQSKMKTGKTGIQIQRQNGQLPEVGE